MIEGAERGQIGKETDLIRGELAQVLDPIIEVVLHSRAADQQGERVDADAHQLFRQRDIIRVVTPSVFSSSYREDLQKTIDLIDTAKVGRAIELLREARDQGRAIFVCGNGGSASTASHFVCDMVKGASFDRESRFRIMALTDSLATITAYS